MKKMNAEMVRKPIDVEKIISDACDSKVAEDEKYFSGCERSLDIPDDTRLEMQGLEEGYLFDIERDGFDL